MLRFIARLFRRRELTRHPTGWRVSSLLCGVCAPTIPKLRDQTMPETPLVYADLPPLIKAALGGGCHRPASISDP
jgi:hypothetical protein